MHGINTQWNHISFLLLCEWHFIFYFIFQPSSFAFVFSRLFLFSLKFNQKLLRKRLFLDYRLLLFDDTNGILIRPINIVNQWSQNNSEKTRKKNVIICRFQALYNKHFRNFVVCTLYSVHSTERLASFMYIFDIGSIQ